MQGTIQFENEEAMAIFLAKMIPISTAVFNAYFDGTRYVLEFTGGY